MCTQDKGYVAITITGRPPDMQARWKEEGLHSHLSAALLSKIVKPGTPAADRTMFFAALTQCSTAPAAAPASAKITANGKVVFSGVVMAGDATAGSTGSYDGGYLGIISVYTPSTPENPPHEPPAQEPDAARVGQTLERSMSSLQLSG
jgi:hypothetical protein